ncbi:phage tail tape measure protein [Roseomonas gilardii]|uniref:phage tail tape measure protein n=1 Tax=Roseomonas gilardii TaxID=257708 RepID=UPI00119FC2CD|nr:phage tail tape measure protein [Roseomonas gilardii]
MPKPDPTEARLLGFTLAPDGSSLIIRERKDPLLKQEDASPNKRVRTVQLGYVADWLLPARAFGPGAFFDMEPAKEADEAKQLSRVVIIRGVHYGAGPTFVLRLVFTHGTVSDPWRLEVTGAPWQAGSGSSEAMLFEEFVAGEEGQAGPASAIDTAKALNDILAGRLQVQVGKPSVQKLTVRLDRDLFWRFEANDPAFAAFGGALRMPRFAFRWALESPPNKPAGWVVTGGAKNDPVQHGFTFGDLRLGPPAGHHARLVFSKQGTDEAEFDVRVAPSLLGPGKREVVACLSVRFGNLSLLNGTQRLIESVRCESLAVTDTVLLNGLVRQTISGKAQPDTPLFTPIGIFALGPPDLERLPPEKGRPVAPTDPAKDPIYRPIPAGDTAASRLFNAATGDKAGAREATVFVVHDDGGLWKGLRRVDIAVALFSADVALPDVSDSKLDFAKADLRLFFEDGNTLFGTERVEYPRQLASSWIWAGPLPEKASLPRAVLDLTRATLQASRDVDLVKLGFRFQDLVLEFTPAPRLRPAHADCRIIARTDDVLVDNRPLLVVDFPPQHVLEEAVFRPNPRPPLDVVLHESFKMSPSEILAELAGLSGPDHLKPRIAYRERVRDNKSAKSDEFRAFAEAFAKLSAIAALPASARDQAIYIGPFAPDDPDVLAAARQLMKDLGDKAVLADLDAALDRLEKLAAKGTSAVPPLRPVVGVPDRSTAGANALANEDAFEQSEPIYGLFRDLWRDGVVVGRVAPPPGAVPPSGFLDLSKVPANQIAAEFLIPGNRPAGYPAGADTKFADILNATRTRFVQVVLGRDEVPNITAARLSRGSRLAFRINCTPLTGLDAQEAATASGPENSPTHPGAGNATYDPLPFTFAALTDWSRHEPEVTRRARRLFAPLESGLLPPLGVRPAQANDLMILRQQGIPSGLGSVARRMAAIQATLVPPTAFETAIEMPARLVLSTAQDAIWLTTRPLDVPPSPKPRPGRHPLWTARLSVLDAEPGLRAVWSPDLRPQALSSRFDGGAPEPLPGHAAPPRGPWAPWLIGPEQSELGTFNAALAKTAAGAGTTNRAVTRFVAWLKGRSHSRAKTPPGRGYHVFRTSLDAWDRHNLVLQSSTYGLPVIGARQATADGSAGALVPDAGQFEPGEDYALFDTQDGDAIYRPVPLDVHELTLTALGGSLLHSTDFVPAGGAPMLRGGMSFDGFSIQRWQHEVVLGRDVRAEMIYKGCLMPCGHRAALVKLTERTFLQTPDQGIKAVLRQRMFLRMKRDTTYPQVGQPFGGRLMPARTVAMIADRTPDLLDPTSPPVPDGSEQVSNGRVSLGTAPGLAFWPRTDATSSGLVQFECMIDGTPTRGPMLFLDKVAATNRDSLAAAAEYYNSDEFRPRRRFPTGGLKIRYAPETVPGDTSLITEYLQFRVHGRLLPDDAKWTGNLIDYQNTPMLEGADQPPFYPAMESAVVRLEQLERFAGTPVRTSVQFDGHYIRNGFDTDRPPSEREETDKNEQELFLDLQTSVRIDMGANGDRSGGIGRPNGTVVAYSRSRGPLTTNSALAWRNGAGGEEAADDVGCDDKPKVVKMPADKTGFDKGLGSLVWMFNVPVQGAPSTRAAVAAPMAAGARAVAAPKNSRKDLLKSLFDPDAKLLGVVTFSELMGWIAEATNMPELKEITDYGTKALHQAEQKVDELMGEVRRRVLLPLHDVVQRLYSAWKKLDEKLGQTAVAGMPPLKVALLFPEVDAGLRDVDAAVDQALAATDPISLGETIGEVFASGRRLAHQIEVLAAHPVQRLQLALEQAVEQQTGALIGTALALQRTVHDELRAWLQVLGNDAATAADRLLTALASDAQALADDIAEMLLLVVPAPPLSATLQVLLPPGAFPKTVAAVAKAEATLQAEGPAQVRTGIRDAARTILADALAGQATKVDELAQRSLGTLRAKLGEDLRKASAALKADLQNTGETVAATVAETLLGLLDHAAEAMERAIDAAMRPMPPEVATVLQGVARLQRLAGTLARLREATGRQDAAATIRAAVDLARDAFGWDVDGLAVQLAAGLSAPVAAGIDGVVKAFPVSTPAVGLPTDAQACADNKIASDAVGSTALLGAIRSSLLETQTCKAALRQLRNAFAQATGVDAELAGISASFDAAELQAWLESSQTLCDALAAHLEALFCHVVGVTASFASLSGQGSDLQHQIAQLGGLAAAGRVIAADVRATVAELASYTANNRKVLQAGVPLGVLKVVLPKLGASADLAQKASDADKLLAQRLATLLELCLQALRAGGLAASSVLDTASTTVAAAESAAARAGLSLKPESQDLLDALAELKSSNEQLASLHLPPAAPASLVQLLATPIDGSGTVGDFFRSADVSATPSFAAALSDLRASEAAALALSHRLIGRVSGLPAREAGIAWQAAAGSKVVTGMRDGLHALRQARDTLYGKAKDLPALAQLLLVHMSDIFPLPPGCTAGSVSLACDRLVQEDALVAGLPGSTSLDPLVRPYLASWTNGTAAPLQIAAKIAQAIALIAHGKVLEALDLGSFRNAIEDALSDLVPTTATLSYDFNTTIDTDPKPENIFQPERGATFGIAVRGVVDILEPKRTSFGAKAHLGPFDIHLIGNIVDALTLSFGGLSFETATNAKPRFEVAYRTFTIGPTLKFAEALQPFLGPKDGNGPYVRPLRTGLGLEAGYGVDLGTIGIGLTSFFNVKLGLSAELPFDDNPALFKVSLGLPTAPFSMSVLPFAGSGYFAILADGKGPIGFEASFEFGAGGALGFGPLQVQARIQIGLYLRLEKTSHGLMATVCGTFFAGGSASIWIFTFATSLYVRLGSQEGGSMQGEAIFTFSFSLGLVDYDYSINVAHTEPAIGKSKDSSALEACWLQYAQNEGPAAASPVLSDATAGPGPARPVSVQSGKPAATSPTVAETWNQADDWVRYARYFDTALLPKCAFDEKKS